MHVKKLRQLQEYVNSCMDVAQLMRENDDENKISEEDDGEESTFIIEGDGEEDQANVSDYQF